jgi:uncharacterized membrane protein YbhN (UPF0104 family)
VTPVGAHAAALGLLLADILVRAVRIRLLLGHHPLPLRQSIAVNALGDAASAVTPARLGGEPARLVALSRYGAPLGPGVVALGVERLVDLSLAALVGTAVVLFLGGRGFGDLDAIAQRLTTGRALPWLVGVAVAVAVSAILAVRLRHRLPVAVGRSLRDASAAARALPGGRLAGAVALTVVSMAARVAILPVLLVGTGALGPVLPAAVGSFALLYAQLILPIPAGAGGVELGFIAGVSPLLGPAETAALLVTWRTYTLILPAGLGLGVWLATVRPPRRLGGRMGRGPASAGSDQSR